MFQTLLATGLLKSADKENEVSIKNILEASWSRGEGSCIKALSDFLIFIEYKIKYKKAEVEQLLDLGLIGCLASAFLSARA